MPSKFGDDGREVTPVPIPNTEVKLSSADGSWDLVPVRVGRRQATLRRVRMTRLFVFIKIRMAGKSQFIKILLYCSHQQVQNAHRRVTYLQRN